MGIFDWLRKGREEQKDLGSAEEEYLSVFGLSKGKKGPKVDAELNKEYNLIFGLSSVQAGIKDKTQELLK